MKNIVKKFFSLTNPILVIILLVSIVVSFNSCSSEKEKITIGYIPIAECIQLYVAKEKGYFDELGVEVELISLAGGANILNALNSNSIDIGFSNLVSLILHRSEGSKFFSIYGGTYEDFRHQNHALLVRADRGINNPRTLLTGASIAVNTYKNIEELMVRKYIKSIGLNWEDLSLINAPFPRMLPLLEAGEIDAASIVEPFITIAKDDSSGKVMNIANQYLATTQSTLVATYVSSENFIKDYPDLASKFIKAMTKATRFIYENEVEAREIIGYYTKIPKDLLTKIGLSKFTDDIDKMQLNMVIEDMKYFKFLEGKRIPTSDELIYK